MFFKLVACSALLLSMCHAEFDAWYRQKRGTNYAKALSDREDLKFALMPNMELWEKLLIPTPTIVSLIGKMVVLSSKVDVSLEDAVPEGGWKHVRHPKSLRASLLQVGNDAWSAFNDAHTNMDAIQLSMLQVPRFVKMAVRFIKRLPFKMIARFLPTPLQAIERSGDRAVELALKTRKAFLDVMALTAELQETVADTQGQTDTKLVATTIKLNASQASKDLWLEEKTRRAQLYNEQKKIVTDARGAYEKAIRELPTGMKALGMDILKGLTDFFTLGFLKKPSSGGGQGSGTDGSNGADAVSMDKRMIQGILQNVLKRAPEMEEYLQTYLNGTTLSTDGEQTGEGENSATTNIVRNKNQFIAMKTLFETSSQTLAGLADSEAKTLAISSLEKIADVAAVFVDKLKGLQSVSDLGSDFINENLEQIVMARNNMTQVINNLNNNQPAGSKPSGNQWNAGTGNFRNERFKINTELDRLKNEEGRLDALNDRLQDAIERLIAVEQQIAQLSLEQVNLEQIIELLRQVLSILGDISELWNELVQFFQRVAVRAQVLNNDFIKPFLLIAEESGATIVDIETDNDEIRLVMVEELIKQAVDINTVSYFLHTMTNTYVQISERFVLKRLAGLAKLLAATTDEQRILLMENLTKESKKAREGITTIMTDLRQRYQREVMLRRQGVESLLNNMQGVAPAEEVLTLEEQLANPYAGI